MFVYCWRPCTNLNGLYDHHTVLPDLFRHRGDERFDSVRLQTSLLLDNCKRGRGLHHSGNHISGIRLLDACSRPGEECFIDTFINRCTQDTIDMEMQSGTSHLPRLKLRQDGFRRYGQARLLDRPMWRTRRHARFKRHGAASLFYLLSNVTSPPDESKHSDVGSRFMPRI
jgi:hypothetical protein